MSKIGRHVNAVDKERLEQIRKQPNFQLFRCYSEMARGFTSGNRTRTNQTEVQTALQSRKKTT